MSIPTPAKYESGASKQPAFSWTFPGSPIRIDVPLALISRLRAELDQREYLASSASESEIGGVLLGHQKTPTVLEIDDYIWVSSEERSGAQYHLDPLQLKNLRFVYTVVVGYFRTQLENNLHLRDEEIRFVGKHFRDPANVVLLIHASTQLCTAGFFFWMQEGVFAPVSFMDFPLDAELLRLRMEASSTDARPAPSAEEVETATASDDTDPPVVVGITSASTEEPISKPARYERMGLRCRSYFERLWVRYSKSVAADGPLTHTDLRIAKTSQKTPTLMISVVAFAALMVGGLFGLLLRDRSSASTQKSPATTALFPLQLEVEAKGDGLNIRWNPKSAPVVQAREGHLAILEDKKPPRIIPLDRQLLTRGHLYYRSSAERLDFQLEIVENSGRVSTESVLALSSKR